MQKYRGSNGKWLTDSLFWENRFNRADIIEDPFTYQREHTKNGRSMYVMYMEADTEYEAAMNILGDWEHWKRLTESNALKDHIGSWREEREEREKAIGKRILIETAEEGNVNAAKALYMGEGSATKKRGRPSKQEVNQEARKSAEVRELVKRGMKVVGGKE